MDQQNRRLDFVRKPKRRHLRVDVRRFPERAPLGLESERRQRAVIRAALGDCSVKQRRVGQQIGGHESAVAVAENADAIAVGNPHLNSLVDRRLRVHLQLLHVGIVHGLGVADDRHRGIVEQRIPLQHEQLVIIQLGKRLRFVTRDLPSGIGIAEFIWICPDHRGQLRARLVIGGQVERERKRHAVRALVSNQLLLDSGTPAASDPRNASAASNSPPCE